MIKMTQKEAKERLAGLDGATAAKVLCALTRHSLIQTMDWGRFYCARCGEFTADALTQSVDQTGFVIVGHNCEVCRTNAETLTWEDTYLSPDPFSEESK